MKHFLLPILLSCIWFFPTSETTASAFSYAVNLAFARNFNEIIPGRLYRSGFVSEDELVRRIKKYSIKTVIDLRLLPEDGSEETRREKAAVESVGAEYYHVRLNSSRIVPLYRFERLVRVLRDSSEPVLIHCTDGTHRSGFATILWLHLHENYSIAKAAEEQFDLRFGFSRIERAWKKQKEGFDTLDTIIWSYLEYRDSTERPRTFIEWATEFTKEHGV